MRLCLLCKYDCSRITQSEFWRVYDSFSEGVSFTAFKSCRDGNPYQLSRISTLLKSK